MEVGNSASFSCSAMDSLNWPALLSKWLSSKQKKASVHTKPGLYKQENGKGDMNRIRSL